MLVGALQPTSALASAAATTGNATSITDSSARLNGVIDPSYSDAAWLFEYSTTPNFGENLQFTRGQSTGPGVTVVAATVDRLSATTAYYYRVIVYQQAAAANGTQFDVGNTVNFKTPAKDPYAITPANSYGKASLTHPSISVAHSVAAVVMSCGGASGALCRAQLKLSAKLQGKPVSCGAGQFIAAAPHTHIVRVRPAGSCLSLLSAARGHRISATLQATFSTHQPQLTRTVTLVG
jgi:hypothetical protein